MRSGSMGGAALRRLSAVVTASLVLALVAAIFAGAYPSGARAQDTQTSANATLRVLHASSGAPAVDVLVNGQPFAKNLAFGAVTDYAPLKEGKYNVQIVPTGQAAANAVTSKDVEVKSGNAYILAIDKPLKDIQLDVYQVNLDAVTAGKARARAIHLSDDAGKVDVAETGGDTLFSGLSQGDNSDYKDIDPGTYSFDIRGDNNRVLLTANNVQISEGNTYDIFVIGEVADKSLAVVPLVTSVSAPCNEVLGIQGQSTDACLRFVHASPGAPAFDIYVNGSLAVKALAYGAATDYLAVPSGDKVSIQITANGADVGNAVINKDFGLDPGQAYEFVATGELNDIQATEASVNLTPLPEGQARVRLIQASTDADKVDVALKDATNNLFEGVGFRDTTDYQVIQAGALIFDIKKNGASDILLEANANLTAGNTYDLIVIGRTSDQSLKLVALESAAAVRQGGVSTPQSAGTPSVAATVVSQATTTELTPATGATVAVTQETVAPTPTPSS
jgi:hypothetical protein